MKEKTFEELAREKVVKVMGFNVLTENEVIQLLQQVREATIAECEKYLDEDVKVSNDYITGREIKINLPTDRIKTDK